LFPDSTLKWKPFPSIIDGIHAPLVSAHGFGQAGLCLTIRSAFPASNIRVFGIDIKCKAYFCIDDLFYGNAGHGGGSPYEGGVYILEATQSTLLNAQNKVDPSSKVRHFRFVGLDLCYEVLGVGVPNIHTFHSEAEADAWALGATI